MIRLFLPSILLAAISAHASAAELTLRGQVVAEGPIVTLGDLVEFDAVEHDAGAFSSVAALATTTIMPAPAPGTQAHLTATRLRDLLAARGIDVAQIRLGGSSLITIFAADPSSGGVAPPANELRGGRRPVQHAPTSRNIEEDLERAIICFLADQATHDQWSLEFRLNSKTREQLANLRGPLRIDGGRAPWTGRQRFLISGSHSVKAAKIEKPVATLVNVSRLQPVLVAVRTIQRGDLVRQSDVAMQMVDRATPASAIRHPQDAVGQEASQTIQEGAYLLESQIKAPLLVRRGETVTVYARTGGVAARTTAVARQDGSRGDLVEVEVLDSKQRLSGHVSGFRQLDVLADGTSVDYDARAALPSAALR